MSRDVRYLNGHALVPIAYVQHRVPMDKKIKVNSYTYEGRKEIHKNLEVINMKTLYELMNKTNGARSVEYNDNRIALYVAQHGKCGITSIELSNEDIDCHHKIPIELGGDDSYSNLIILHNNIHKLIHAKDKKTISKYLNKFNLNSKQLSKINKLRILAKQEEISMEMI